MQAQTDNFYATHSTFGRFEVFSIAYGVKGFEEVASFQFYMN